MSKTTDYSWEHHDQYLGKTLLFARKGYEVYLQVDDYIPVLHFEIEEIKPSIYKQLLADVNDFKRILKAFALPEVFGLLPEEKKHLGKLYSRLGLEKIGEGKGQHIYMMRTN